MTSAANPSTLVCMCVLFEKKFLRGRLKSYREKAYF